MSGIDWEKVGKIYKPESAVEHIVSKEMARLQKAFDSVLETQDGELEERAKGGKKK